MKRETILAVLKANADELQSRFGVRRIGLFGSTVRGEAGSASDVDLLVSFNRPTFDAYIELKFHLEELLGTPVDLVMESALRPRLRAHILREVQYAA